MIVACSSHNDLGYAHDVDNSGDEDNACSRGESGGGSGNLVVKRLKKEGDDGSRRCDGNAMQRMQLVIMTMMAIC